MNIGWRSRFAGLRSRDASGQSTAEYALVIVAAAVLGGLLISFLTKSNVIAVIFTKVVSFVTKSIL